MRITLLFGAAAVVLFGVALCAPSAMLPWNDPAARAEEAGADRTRLPLGDGRVAREPLAGAVWPCAKAFGGGGAFRAGPWLNGDGTFDLTAKVVVDGDVPWPYELVIALEGERRTIVGNGLPVHATGIYPVSPTDDAYQYDRNPNAIAPWNLRLSLPALPLQAEASSCLPLGPIGVLLTGAAFFNALDEAGRDAVAHEAQDACQGHPERGGIYHYHSLTTCQDDHAGGHSPLMGYAFDGFGLYGRHGEWGDVLTNADLDACHGHTHAVEWDGQVLELYHYHATWEYPYTLGCYRGAAVRTAMSPGVPPRP